MTMTRFTLRYDNGALLQIRFNCSEHAAIGYKQGYVNFGTPIMSSVIRGKN